jgi:alcohol dehydrogenase
MTGYRAFWVERGEAGVTHRVVERQVADLPDHDTLVRVEWSSLNYKDALSALGKPGVTRNYPHQPGIDAAGRVVSCATGSFASGDPVIVTGYDLGMDTPGGYGEYVRVPAAWLVPLPPGLGLRDSMILGTAGLTAALCLDKLQRMGAKPEDGPVIVTGASGGVGSLAVMLLARLGFEVVACSGKGEQSQWLQSLGAASVIGREALATASGRPLLAATWAHGIDTVGGVPLANLMKSLMPGGSVAACGLVASASLETTVLPFLLRGVNLLGVDSVSIPLAAKAAIWQRLAGPWRIEHLDRVATEVGLEGLSAQIDRIFAGEVAGRVVVHPGPR